MKKLIFMAAIVLVATTATAQSLADLFETHKNSVVTIYVAEAVNPGTGDPVTFTSNMGLGSGILVNDKIVLTASHVVANAEKIMVQFYDGEAIPASVRRINRLADVAVIELTQIPENAKIAKLADSDQVRIGEDIFVIGAPMGLPYSLSSGIISGKQSEPNITHDGEKVEFLQTDASINTGNSGGPMFNMQGEVVGVVSSILTRSGGFEGIGFAATSNISKTLLLNRSSRFFGIECMILNPEMTRILNVPQESGWLVTHVVQNSPANIAGLKGGYLKVYIQEQEVLLGGDVILSVDDIVIRDEDSLERLRVYLDSITTVKTHKIKVLRGGEILELRWVSREFESRMN